MLRKKTSGVAQGPQSSSFIGKAAEKVVDRRAFLRGSGLAIGGLATAAAVVGSNVSLRKLPVPVWPQKSKSQFVRIVPSVVRWLPKCKMACGLVKSRAGIARLTLAHTAQRVHLFAKLRAVSGA